MKDRNDHDDAYDLKSVKMPYLSGFPLRLIAGLVEGPLRGLLAPNLLSSAGLAWLRKQEFDERPTLLPIASAGSLAVEEGSIPQDKWPAPPVEPGPGFRFPAVFDYARAYHDGKVTPEEVAQRVLESIGSSEAARPPLRAFIAVDREDVLRQARESTERIKNGRPLSVFDGVPVAVKDELDMTPYPTTLGTSFLGKNEAVADATAVARLRRAGALLVGKANMHEIGLGVTGLNAHHGTPRNPYDASRYTGGSSSGPAAAVAAGLCPVALGADGGGSIRIPSSFCGLVGLKPTFGRVSEFGAAALGWSVAHVGPLAATATDAALAYCAVAGPDPKDRLSLHQPSPKLAAEGEMDWKNMTLGIYRPWFRHASAEVVSACESMVEKMVQAGAGLRDIVIPDLEANRVAHLVTIAGEMTRSQSIHDSEHRRDYGLDVRINLALARMFTARDYIKAQQIRTRMMSHFQRALEQADVILTPSTGIVAPVIPKTALPGGDSDLTTLTEIMRFSTGPNMTGLPAISFPVGYSRDGLPIGMQAIGRAWQEHVLLWLAAAAERFVERRVPAAFYRILPQSE